MKKIIALGITAIASLFLFSQESLKSIEEGYYDYLSLTGLIERPYIGYRNISNSVWNIDSVYNHPWKFNNLGSSFEFFSKNEENYNFYDKGVNPSLKLRFYGPELFNSYNTYIPNGFNDGGLWQGVGYNASITGGIHFEAFGFELTYKPQISFSQNRVYDYLQGPSKFSEYNYWSQLAGTMDYVQRYGSDSFFNYDWGDSEFRYTFYNFTIGFGTSNPWIGPAYVNSMLGSNNAGGYPKLDFGLLKTKIIIPYFDYYLGDLEARGSIGKLSESDYFDADPNNNHLMLHSFSFGISPSFMHGFSFGANRVFLCKWSLSNLRSFQRLFKFGWANDIDGPGEDQKVSVYFDWLFPSVGFELYSEYGFDDFTGDKKADPFHTGIITVGLKKNIDLWKSATERGIRCEAIFEFSNFEMSQDYQLQQLYGGYYTHHQMVQGYTHNGQILGAGTGFMGNSQFAGLNIFYPKGFTTIYLHRSCPDNNHIYNMGVWNYPDEAMAYYAINITFVDVGIKSSYFVTPSIIVNGALVYDFVHNWKYERPYDINNCHIELGLKYNF